MLLHIFSHTAIQWLVYWYPAISGERSNFRSGKMFGLYTRLEKTLFKKEKRAIMQLTVICWRWYWWFACRWKTKECDLHSVIYEHILWEYQGWKLWKFKNILRTKPRLNFWKGYNVLCGKIWTYNTIMRFYLNRLKFFFSLNGKSSQNATNVRMFDMPIHVCKNVCVLYQDLI